MHKVCALLPKGGLVWVLFSKTACIKVAILLATTFSMPTVFNLYNKLKQVTLNHADLQYV